MYKDHEQSIHVMAYHNKCKNLQQAFLAGQLLALEEVDKILFYAMS